MLHQADYILKSDTREAIREELVYLFLKEKSGLELDSDGSRPTYHYIVEKMGEYRVYLQRPAQLNKGFDFVVNVENMYFKIGNGRKHKNPSHNDIVSILLAYKINNGNIYPAIKNLIQDIFDCKHVDIIAQTNGMPPFVNYDEKQIPIAIILFSIKWLFIEQDITYWNYSGRFMLFQHLKDVDLV